MTQTRFPDFLFLHCLIFSEIVNEKISLKDDFLREISAISACFRLRTSLSRGNLRRMHLHAKLKKFRASLEKTFN